MFQLVMRRWWRFRSEIFLCGVFCCGPVSVPILVYLATMFHRLVLVAAVLAWAHAADVKVDITDAKPENAPVTTASSYDAMVTLSIENEDGSTTPSGWSTRKEHNGNGAPCRVASLALNPRCAASLVDLAP